MKNFKIFLALLIGFSIGAIVVKLSTTYGLGNDFKQWEINQQKTENKNNDIIIVWEGSKLDIPADGDQLLNLSTNENVIYLNPVDE
jgi:hypothetical protein